MGCCSLKKDPDRTPWASLVLVCAPLELFGALALALLAPLPGAAGLRERLRCLVHRNRWLLNRRFRHHRLHTAASGVLLRRSPWLAGVVFRRLYPSLAAAGWLAGAALAASLLGWLGAA